MRNLIVMLGEQKVGRLIALDRGKIGFQYDPVWLEIGFSLSPLHLKFEPEIQFPDIADARSFYGLFGVFADSLPDGWGMRLMNKFFSGKDIHPVTTMDRLAYIGSKGMGALVYRPETNPAEPELIDLEQMLTASQIILNGDTSEVIEQLYRDGGSPGGARPKVTVAFSKDMQQCYSGVCDAPEGCSHWLVKFRQKDDVVEMGAIEKSLADMAALADVYMPTTDLITVGDKRFFAVKRFDRENNRKIHMHTMAGFLHADFGKTSLDYDNLMGAVGYLTKNINDVERMYKIAIFNVLAGNQDDHAKNFSFIHDNKWELAPAYDLTYAVSYMNEHATTMMGNGVPTRKEMIKLAQTHGIELYEDIIEQTRNAISEWKTIAKNNGISNDVISEYSKHFNKIDNVVR
jgi:serine/threonine-protein kinase HipA